MAQTFAGSGDYQYVTAQSITIAQVNTVATSVQTFTGVIPANFDVNNLVRCEVQGLTAGLYPIRSRISATGVLEITFWNSTGGNLTPGAKTLNLIIL